MATFSDDFNRANGAVGANWEGTDSGGFLPVIATNRITGGSTASLDYTMRVPIGVASFSANQSVTWKFSSSTDTYSSQHGVLRSTGIDTTHNCYTCAAKQVNKTFRVWKVVAGVSTMVATYTAAVAPTVNDIMRCTVDGTVINFYRNNVLMVSFDDTTSPIESGQPGLRITRDAGNLTMDDFNAADLVTTGTSSISLDGISSVSIGSISISGSSNLSLDTIDSSSSGVVGDVSISGSSTITLSNLTRTASGSVSTHGTHNKTLLPLSQTSIGVVKVSGDTTKILSGITQAASGVVVEPPSTGVSEVLLSVLSGSSSGTVRDTLVLSPEDRQDIINQVIAAMSIPTASEIATAVWSSAEAMLIKDTSAFTMKVLLNKREIKQVGPVWYLTIYDDDSITPILLKELKDVSGQNISNLIAGALAIEGASSV